MKNIDISFLCVQPVHISNTLFSKILVNKVKFKGINRHSKVINEKSKTFEWFYTYNKLHRCYKPLRQINLNDISTDILINDLDNEEFFIHNSENEALCISEFLSHDTTSFTLYYDPRFLYFILVFQIDFSFPYETIDNFLKYCGKEYNEKKNDFYNVIRNLIVKESDNSQLSIWAEQVYEVTLSSIDIFLKRVFNIYPKSSDIEIRKNNGNISCFIMDDNKDSNDIFCKFNELNRYAERLPATTKGSSYHDNTVQFSFNGRFHTVYLKNRQDIHRFQPLQFHIQYVWFLVNYFNNFMEEINLFLMENNSTVTHKKYSKILHYIINKIELLNLHDSNFKFSIEVDSQTIYVKNEKKWSIQESLQSSYRYVKFFRDYLDRLSNQRSIRSQKKQNNILLLISILQLVALISVWKDYLDLLVIKNLDVTQKVMNVFGTKQDLLNFNLITPLIVTILVFLIFIYLFIMRNK